MIALGIDAGGTATRWHLCATDGSTIASGEAAALTGHVFTEASRADARRKLQVLAANVLIHARPLAIMAGITGLDADTAAASSYVAELADAFAVPQAAIVVENDMGIALRAATEPGHGILVYSGTGSVACHMAADGAIVRVGGRGVIIDDGGSGFWIAKEAVKWLFRREDAEPGAGFATPLGRRLADGVGGVGWAPARAFIYGGERGRVATLARVVADAANDGDVVARRILQEAGRELADLAITLLRRLGPREVILAGGATLLHPIVPAAVEQTIQASYDVAVKHIANLDSAQAAARAALTFDNGTRP